ncbi:hypothetical protein EHS25_000552 [Saitozyma podzolica]|uniref:Uncharacterized protein n=1 Tax=Saitozyma podzolica TaxID=1890683 RepID=A0A427YWF3_9TREE|nr:hypothetical protein EHS25_000552 [Saitozyma podzolica]
MTSTQSLAAPIMIPLPSSRSPTPVARRIDLPDPEDLPLAPDPSRARSDTICTTSSSSSSPYLQTPETPSIIGALASDSPLKPFDRLALSSPDSTSSRKDGYGFGVLWEDGPAVPVAGPSRHERSDSEWSMRFVEDETNETDPPAPAFVLEPEAQMAWDEEPDGSDDDGADADGTPPDAAEVVESPEAVPSLKGKRSFKAVMRRKLERSKSSLQSLRRSSRESEASIDSEGERRRKGRLRSLLSLSRSESSTSIRSFASVSTNRASSPAFVNAPSPSPGPIASASLVGRDHATTGDYFGHSSLPLAQEVDQVIGKGKGRASGRLDLSSGRPDFASGRLSKKSSFAPAPIPPSPLQQASVTASTPGRPRAASMPAHLSLPTKPKVDLFDSMLPRELRVMVMRILVESHPETGSRWDGEAAGRRELIKLSRVSQSTVSKLTAGVQVVAIALPRRPALVPGPPRAVRLAHAHVDDQAHHLPRRAVHLVTIAPRHGRAGSRRTGRTGIELAAKPRQPRHERVPQCHVGRSGANHHHCAEIAVPQSQGRPSGVQRGGAMHRSVLDPVGAARPVALLGDHSWRHCQPSAEHVRRAGKQPEVAADCWPAELRPRRGGPAPADRGPAGQP